VVTALVPAHDFVPMYATKFDAFDMPGLDVADTRSVTRVLAGAVLAAREAADAFKQSASLEGFVAGVEKGISRELVDSLHMLAAQTDGADISIEWGASPSNSLFEEPPP